MSSEASPSIQIAAIQPNLRSNDVTPLSSTRHVVELMERAAKKGDIDLFVLPELCPIGYTEDTFCRYLKRGSAILELIGEIDNLICSCAKNIGCCICYGTIGVYGKSSERFTIQQVIVDKAGSILCRYDKIHLCNYGDCSETRFFEPGKDVRSFLLKGFHVGIIICADMRNPSLCRTLAKPPHNCDVILQPAAFSRDISFRTWNSFRETRAVENSVYFVAVNYAGECYGNSAILEPWVDENHEPEILGTEEGVIVKEIRKDVLDKIRADFPYHEQLMKEAS